MDTEFDFFAKKTWRKISFHDECYSYLGYLYNATRCNNGLSLRWAKKWILRELILVSWFPARKGVTISLK